MSARITNMDLAQAASHAFDSQIKIVKPDARAIIPSRRDELLAHLDETLSRVGRLAKDLRDIRAEVLSLTIES